MTVKELCQKLLEVDNQDSPVEYLSFDDHPQGEMRNWHPVNFVQVDEGTVYLTEENRI